MAANQDYESIEMVDDDDDDDDDHDDEDRDVESPPKKRTPPKKRPRKKRRAPPGSRGCCLSFFCAFLLALLVILGLLVGAYYVLVQKGYHFAATQSDGSAVDTSWLAGHGWHRPKSFDSSDATTAESSDSSGSDSVVRSRGHNTEDPQTSAETPVVPLRHSPSHITVNSVPGVNVVAPGSLESKATTGVNVVQVLPIAAETSSPATPVDPVPLNEEETAEDEGELTEEGHAEPSGMPEDEPTQPPLEEIAEATAAPEDQSDKVEEETSESDVEDQQVDDQSLGDPNGSSEPVDEISDDDALSKGMAAPP